MSKGHTRTFVKKHLPATTQAGVNSRPEVRVRELPPKFDKDGKDAVILCPFCDIPHPISIGKDSPCGTNLRLTAVQTIFPARTVKKLKLVCMKCHQSDLPGQTGGDMIQFNNAFVHLIDLSAGSAQADCAPGTKLIAVPPKFSKVAQVVHNLPLPIRRAVERRMGYAKPVTEVDPEGNETGKTLGYFFYKASA